MKKRIDSMKFLEELEEDRYRWAIAEIEKKLSAKDVPAREKLKAVKEHADWALAQFREGKDGRIEVTGLLVHPVEDNPVLVGGLVAEKSERDREVEASFKRMEEMLDEIMGLVEGKEEKK